MEVEYLLCKINKVHGNSLVQWFNSDGYGYSNCLLKVRVRTEDRRYMSFTVSLFEPKSTSPGEVLEADQ